MTLHLVPCACVWLEVEVKDERIIAICKWCKIKGSFTIMEWETLLFEGAAVNKPVRI